MTSPAQTIEHEVSWAFKTLKILSSAAGTYRVRANTVCVRGVRHAFYNNSVFSQIESETTNSKLNHHLLLTLPNVPTPKVAPRT